MSSDPTQLLAEIPLFSTMDDEERRQLRAIMRERSFEYESWVSALGALLNAATLIMSSIEDGLAGPAHLLYKSGCQLVNDLKDYFKISPVQIQAGAPKSSFKEAYTRLKSAGFCLTDPEPALASFIVLQSAYAEALHNLMKYCVVFHRKF